MRTGPIKRPEVAQVVQARSPGQLSQEDPHRRGPAPKASPRALSSPCPRTRPSEVPRGHRSPAPHPQQPLPEAPAPEASPLEAPPRSLSNPCPRPLRVP